jgi:hypothetical protein
MAGLFGISSTFIFLSVLIAVIWVFVEVKRLKHKIFAMVLIAFIIFSYFSFFAIFKSPDVDIKTPKGMFDATKIYYSWLVSLFTNLKTLTANAIHLDWKPDNSTKIKNTFRR